MAKRILIVDDETNFRYAASIALRKRGFETSEAESAERAMAMIISRIRKGENFDLLLLDIQLPGISGIEMFDFLKRNGISMPIIAISGFASKADIQGMLSQGCDDYMDKPFEPDELIRRVEEVLQRKGEEVET